MNRRDFLKACAALGGSMPFFAGLAACASDNGVPGDYWDFDVNFTGRVLVIGAGSAGLAAGYLLDRYGVDYEILEAGSGFGGRVQRLSGFMDFPIDLGAEWIHADPGLLSRLIDDDTVQGTIDTVRYTPETYAVARDGGGVVRVDAMQAYYGEYKFKTTTWFDFLETYIQPASADRIRLNTQVVGIDTSGDRVVVTLADGSTEAADRVLITVPIGILQKEVITFTPELPSWKRSAIDTVTFTSGLKVFLEFSERFYPDLTVMSPLSEDGATDHLAIDGAFRKGSERHLLTLFCVGAQSKQYIDLSDAEIIDLLVSKLDAAYDGAASQSLIQGRVQNWSQQPHIQGAYSYGWGGDFENVIENLQASVENRLYWAGSGTSMENTSTVHGAMQSGYDAVKAILGD